MKIDVTKELAKVEKEITTLQARKEALQVLLGNCDVGVLGNESVRITRIPEKIIRKRERISESEKLSIYTFLLENGKSTIGEIAKAVYSSKSQKYKTRAYSIMHNHMPGIVSVHGNSRGARWEAVKKEPTEKTS